MLPLIMTMMMDVADGSSTTISMAPGVKQRSSSMRPDEGGHVAPTQPKSKTTAGLADNKHAAIGATPQLRTTMTTGEVTGVKSPLCTSNRSQSVSMSSGSSNSSVHAHHGSRKSSLRASTVAILKRSSPGTTQTKSMNNSVSENKRKEKNLLRRPPNLQSSSQLKSNLLSSIYLRSQLSNLSFRRYPSMKKITMSQAGVKAKVRVGLAALAVRPKIVTKLRRSPRSRKST